MRTFGVALVLSLALLGCEETPTGVTQLPLTWTTSGGPVSAQVAVGGQGPATQGRTLPVHVLVTNVSRGPVVVAHASIRAGRRSADYQWRDRVYGSVSYDEQADRYYLNEMAQMEAIGANWTTGLLLPGEVAECALSVQLLESGPLDCGLSLAYYAGTFEEMAPRLYLERERDAFNVTYGPTTPEELRSLAQDQLPRVGPRVLIQRADPAPMVAAATGIVNVAPAAFRPEQAMAKAGLTTAVYAHSEKRGGWVLQGPESVVLVTPTAVRRYPGCNLGVWQFVEQAGDKVYFWYLTDDPALHALFRPYEFMEGMGFHAYVPRDAALRIIRRAHESGYLALMSEFQFTPCVSFEPIGQGPSG
jgi:hypothetical protein